MGLKRVAIICLFVLLAGAAISIILNIKDTLVDKSDEILIKDNNYTNIHVESGNASVEILPTKESETKVEYSGKIRKKFNYRFHAEVKRDTLFVELNEKRWNFFHFGFGPHSIKLTIHVPEKEYNELKTELDNGRINVHDINVQAIDLETDNGIIDLQNVEAQTIRLKSDNGQILMQDVNGSIDAETDNGRIILTTTDLDRPIDLKTDNGLIEIQTDKEPTNATIHVKVDNGRINVFGAENKQTVFGDGVNKINLESDNGRITVKKR
ncbi:DUF4097 family beta strand repeat-containing protein [Psychrobacillus soli]|uniref:DUF4097 domain-containing protein n=1 Tax=Psychrobacillus soli TaxID=1543965 RepID=A0A544TM45_9BACI|nr:DUF4097 family beta strand repeat-containing protein [Psychrobacillus soli]TQR18506.1 DUF4097 domain-containing protein [Psychrobacillus soli]